SDGSVPSQWRWPPRLRSPLLRAGNPKPSPTAFVPANRTGNSHIVLKAWPDYVPAVTITPLWDQVVTLQAR
ncbi:hypothetical protein M9458_010518, partial [Cirrhinus mrigala]